MKIALTLRLVLYPTAVLLGLAIFLAHLALFSETGGHWIVGQIEKRVEGLQLAYRGGTVARGLDFTDVRLSRPGLDISAHGVSIKVNLPAMLAGKIKLQRVGVRALAVSYKAVQAPGTPSSPVDITTSITIADAHVENAVVRIDDAAPIRLDTAEASVALSGEHLQLHDVRVRQSTLVVRGTWQMVLNAPYTFGGQFNLAGIAQGVPPIVGHLRGDSEKIRIGAGFAPPDNVTMSANIDPAKGRFDASADITTLDLKALTGQPLALTGGALEAAGEYRNFRYSGHASVDNPWLSHLNAKLSGNFSGETLDVSGLHMLADRTSVDGSGNYDFATHTLAAKLGGILFDKPLDGVASATLASLAALTGKGHVSLAKNRLTFSTDRPGRIKVALSAPQPDVFLAGASGTVSGNGTVDVAGGGYTVELSGRQLGFHGQSVARAKVNVSRADGVNHAVVDAVSWRAGDTRLGAAHIDYRGNDFARGELQLNWQPPQGSLDLDAHIDYADGRAQGRIESGRVRVDDQDWKLDSVAKFVASAPLVTLADQCWRHGSDSVCLSGARYESGQGGLHIAVNRLGNSLRVSGFDAKADFSTKDALHYQIVGDGDVSIPGASVAFQRLHLTIRGKDADWIYAGDAGFDNPLVAGARIRVSGKGSDSGVSIEPLAITDADRQLALTGRYHFADARLTGKIFGQLGKHKVAGDVDIARLDGKAKGRVHAEVAGNTIDAQITDANLLEIGLAANDLSNIDPGMQGKLDGKVTANLAQNTYSAGLSSTLVKIGNYGISGLQFSSSGSTSTTIKANLTVSAWRYAGQPMGSIDMDFGGKPSEGRFSAKLGLPVGDFTLGANIGYRDGMLKGRVLDGRLAAENGPWILQSPFEFSADSGRSTLNRQCWVDGDGKVCLGDTIWGGRQGHLQINVSGVPIQVNKPWFAPDVDIDAKIDASLEIAMQDAGSGPGYNGVFRLDMPGAKVSYLETQSLVMDVSANAQVRDNALTGSLDGKNALGDLLGLKLDVPNVLNPRAVRGKATLHTRDLGVLVAFIPALDRGKGALDAEASFDTVKSPITADLAMKISDDASVDIPLAGITLSALDLKAHGDARRINIDASGVSGGGSISAKGAIVDPFSATRHAEISVKGDKFKLLGRPDMNLIASPDVTLKVDAHNNLAITGKLAVDDGSFTMRDGDAQMRHPSSDIVVVAGAEPSAPQSKLDLDLDVSVNKFAVNMYGLESGVQGEVNLVQQAMSPRHAQGTLNLVNGSFSRYGQTFNIDRGRLIFSGPLDDPLVDVTSSRTITQGTDTIKVSLALSGPATNIKTTISADPAMSGASALSYLILGHGLDSATSAEGQSLSGAALALGLKQALPITEQIKSALGLSTLSVASNGIDSTSVIAGKRINPDLYVQYNYDVFSRIGGIMFNYQLTPRLSVQTRSGEAKSMELLYNF